MSELRVSVEESDQDASDQDAVLHEESDHDASDQEASDQDASDQDASDHEAASQLGLFVAACCHAAVLNTTLPFASGARNCSSAALGFGGATTSTALLTYTSPTPPEAGWAPPIGR